MREKGGKREKETRNEGEWKGGSVGGEEGRDKRKREVLREGIGERSVRKKRKKRGIEEEREKKKKVIEREEKKKERQGM